MKDGIQTSEFWVTISVIATAIATFLNDLIGQGVISTESKWVVIAGAILAGVYTLARSLYKGKGLIKLIPLFAMLAILPACTVSLPQAAIEANTLRHANMEATVSGMRDLVDQSQGAAEFKQAVFKKLDYAMKVENALHGAMDSYLKAEEMALEKIRAIYEQLKGGLENGG